MTYEGVLPVNKPAGFTSHDVVAKVRRLIRMKRIGHAGTLDPQVTGVLPLCLGRATRIVEYLQEMPKQYEAEMTIGYATDTEDWTGAVTERLKPELVAVSEADVRQALARFQGEVEQIPPMYSAVKVGGKKLYELAREGKEIERKARRVTIYRTELLDFGRHDGYPRVRFRVDCSKGTYIRTLCADLGKSLGFPAVMTDLRRTSTGSIGLESCLGLDEVEKLAGEGRLSEYLIPLDRAIAHLPAFTVSQRAAEHAVQGKPVYWKAADRMPSQAEQIVRLYAPDGLFLGIFQTDRENECFRPEKVFAGAGGGHKGQERT